MKEDKYIPQEVGWSTFIFSILIIVFLLIELNLKLLRVSLKIHLKASLF